MKDLSVLRRMVMIILLLGSVYLVFDTVVTSLSKVSEKEQLEEVDLDAYNKLLEKFDVLTTPEEPDEKLAEDSGETEEAQKSLVDQVEQQQREEQDRKDRALAHEELMKSIRAGEANQKLQAAAKPLIELEDIRVDPNLELPETLPDFTNGLIGSTPDAPN